MNKRNVESVKMRDESLEATEAEENLAKVKTRIEELESLDSLTLVEQEELDKLKEAK